MSTSTSVSSSTSLLNAIVGGSRGSDAQLFRPIGAAATFGLSLVLLRLAASANHVPDGKNNYGGEPGQQDAQHRDVFSVLLNRSETLFLLVKNLLRQIVLKGRIRGKLENDCSVTADDADSEEEDNIPVLHKGSCHCRSVCFELVAPQKLVYRDALHGKIQYRHARVRANTFRFVKGIHIAQMYYVKVGNEETAAHSFCSRCGVSLLHAPNSQSSALDVNVDCLNPTNVKLKLNRGKMSNLSEGSSVDGQWGQEHDSVGRYPATIAEEQSPMVMRRPVDKSQFSNYHPLLRNDSEQLFEAFQDFDDSTVDRVVLGGEKVVTPTTPSTIHTSQTESYVSSFNNGSVPFPTLTLDTRDCNNDTESVVSFSSTRSNRPSSTNGISLYRHRSSSLGMADSSYGGTSAQSATGYISTVSPSTTPLVRHQMQYYMRKHMASSSSSVASTSIKQSSTS